MKAPAPFIALEEDLVLNLQFKKRGGLLPVAVQETTTGELLMLASVNQEAVQKSLETKKATFFSTSRKELWTKGETSGDFLQLDAILVDCDQDALIYKVTLLGEGVCHTSNKDKKHRKACFYREINLENATRLMFVKGRE